MKIIIIDGTIDKLISDKLITPEMATSLLNNNKTTRSVTKHLIYAAELIYVESDTLSSDFEE